MNATEERIKDEVLLRMGNSLKKNKTPKDIRFWEGFLVALSDYHVVSFSTYRFLRDWLFANYRDWKDNP